ncbi:hypothetical protein NQ317_013768 [Molorchus minor]|uniref:Lipase domain-containing protein n=1 Tax=Molorchus minor TaxID=1323400 RepID=A0ABQ9JR70_9CUCU|nr:hypothetical protein NQ317_013768 [Molorchus minor]
MWGMEMVSGQWSFPKLSELPKISGQPDLSGLPTAESFLQNLLNVTSEDLVDVVNNFTFDDVLSGQIKFLLYKKDGSFEEFDGNSRGIPIADSSESIIFIIHGWQSAGDTFVVDMAKAYHSIGTNKVFGVEWSSHSQRNYLHSARATKKVGEVVGEFIINLTKNDTKMLSNIHIVGHSLGAQIAGFAGKQVKDLSSGQQIGRITGLDAAAPLFEFPIKKPDRLRIAKEDASYVDGIHTNMGFFGVVSSFGDADYYVNYGGPIQPECVDVNILEALQCSHSEARIIFTRSITSKDFIATSCSRHLKAITNTCENNKTAVLGEHTSTDAKGNYFYNTDGIKHRLGFFY